MALHLGMPVDPVPTGSERTRRCLGECGASVQLGFELSFCCCSTCGGEPHAKEEGNGVAGMPVIPLASPSAHASVARAVLLWDSTVLTTSTFLFLLQAKCAQPADSVSWLEQ